MLSMHYHELIGKIEEDKGKNILIVDDYMLHKVLHKIKEITGIERFYNIKILMDAARCYYFKKCCGISYMLY